MKLKNQKIKNLMYNLSQKIITIKILNFFTILVLLITLILSSCNFSSNTGQVKNIDIFKGTKGLELTLKNPQVLSNIFVSKAQNSEGTDIPVVLQIQNKGAMSIDEGILTVETDSKFVGDISFDSSSYDNNFQSSSAQNSISFNLKGKSLAFPEGESAILSFNMKAKALPSEGKNTFLILKSCYKYSTLASVNLCYGNPASSGCDYNSYKSVSLSDGQGAPVVVTKVDQNVVDTGDDFQIFLDIFIDNPSGQMITLPKESNYLCGIGNEPITSIGQIEIEKITFAGNDAENDISSNCVISKSSTENTNIFDISRRHFVCQLRGSKSEFPQSYLTLLQLKLNYGYVEVNRNVIEFNNIQNEMWY